MNESSISIINKNNGTLTGEKATALPIKLVSNISWFRIFLLGVLCALFFMFLFFLTIKKKVVVVEVSGKAADYQILEMR